MSPACLEPEPRRIHVDAPAEIEVLLGLAAHDRREVEHAVDVRREDARHERRVRQVACDGPNARILGHLRRDDIDQNDLAHTARRAVCVGQVPAVEDRARKLAAEESGTTGDHDAHGLVFPVE